MTQNDWNPDLYLKFYSERIQPTIDLASRIRYEHPGNILDVGCGPGNSTQILAKKWKNSKITGIDNSRSMIEKARKEYPNQNWKFMDASENNIKSKYDIVFSNSVIHWIPNHTDLLQKLYGILNNKGVLAIGIPLFWDMPLGKSIERIAQSNRWKEYTSNVSKLFTIHDYPFYYDILSELFNTINIWETNYMHIFNSHISILDMIRSTGLKPYLEKLSNDSDKLEFEKEVLKSISKDYLLQNNGNVVFTFKRLFFVAHN